jgi:hypothetical protein
MSEENEAFLARWSRLKTEAREAPKEDKPAEPAPPPAKAGEQAPVLPPVKDLTPESDFRPFMNPKVDDATRREALKKLFADPHFNVPDPFEAYSEDYTGGEPIPAEMLKTLNQAKRLLFDEAEKTTQAAAEKPEQAAAGKPEPTPQDAKDAAGRQDA